MTDKTNPIAHAVCLLRKAAQELQQGHTLGATPNDWTGEPEAKAAYDEHMGAAAALEASAGSEPVATVFTMEALTPGGGVKYHATIHKPLPAGTKLYTHPSPPEGMVMVPKEPTAAMRKAAADAWLDCGSKMVLNKAAAAVAAGIAAAPPTAQAEGWRLIETAPKDGSYLLLWEQYSDAPFVGYWSGGSWSVSHEHVDAEGGWDGANVVDALSMPITHWMPIPAPPTSAEGVEHG